MHLSRLTLNLRNPAGREAAAHPYEFHRALAPAFPTPDGLDYRAHHAVLFRLDPPVPGAPGPTVLVQSSTRPDWNRLPTALLLEAQSKPFDPIFESGQSLAFRLLANPTSKQRRPGRAQGNRVPLSLSSHEVGQPAPALAWLDRQAQRCGIAVTQVSAVPVEFARASDGKASIPHVGVRFDGLLRVTDPAALRHALEAGIGPAKAFGFGLLSLAQIL